MGSYMYVEKMRNKVFLVYIVVAVFSAVGAGDVQTQIDDIEMKVNTVEDKVEELRLKTDTISKSLDSLLKIIKQHLGKDVVSIPPTDGVKGILVAGGSYISSSKRQTTH